MTTATRRTLTFATLEDADRDAEMLLAQGYDKTGNWDIGQVCGHLTHWFNYPIDGFPRTPLLLRPMFWIFRNTIAPRMLNQALASGSTKSGIPTIPASVPQPGDDAALAVKRFQEAIARWQKYDGPIQASPLFGNRIKDDWSKMHLMHCAHHLGFLVPKAG